MRQKSGKSEGSSSKIVCPLNCRRVLHKRCEYHLNRIGGHSQSNIHHSYRNLRKLVADLKSSANLKSSVDLIPVRYRLNAASCGRGK